MEAGKGRQVLGLQRNKNTTNLRTILMHYLLLTPDTQAWTKTEKAVYLGMKNFKKATYFNRPYQRCLEADVYPCSDVHQGARDLMNRFRDKYKGKKLRLLYGISVRTAGDNLEFEI